MEGIIGKKIVLTGGVGFIGSHLAEALVELGVKVFIPYIAIESDSYFTTQQLNNKTIIEKVDITDKRKIEAYVLKIKPDYILHLAAQTLATKAYENPYETLNSNIMGTVHLLDILRKNSSIKGMIVASSDKAYGKTQEAYSENSPLKGDHPYDVSKSAADLITSSYFKTYKTPVVITRFGNVYGEGDLHFDRIVPGICKSVIKSETLEIRSDGTFIRDYLYVKDVVSGYLLLLKNIGLIHGEAYNFSSFETLSVLEIIEKYEKVIGKKINYKILNNAKNEIPYQHLNDEKVKKLGWITKYSTESTGKNIFNWYSEHFGK